MIANFKSVIGLPSHRECWFLIILLCCIFLEKSYEDDPVASKHQSQESEKLRRRCPFSLRKLWQTDVSSFPFAASPLIADIDGDEKLDIVAAPFGETITVLEGDTGKHLKGSGWPRHNLDKSIHSSPLQFDIDGDGILDLLFITSRGEGVFYNRGGYQLHMYTFEFEPAYVKSEWFDNPRASNPANVQETVLQEPMEGYIPVDPHVFDTPVLHEKRYLVLPISFFFSEDDYRDQERGPWGANAEHRDKYYVTAVAILDLQRLQSDFQDNHGKSGAAPAIKVSPYARVIFLELNQTPVVSLFKPTVVDLDCDFSQAEIIIGSSSGNLYVLTWDGQQRKGFPQTFGSISGRITAVNLDDGPGKELIVPDQYGNITCLDGVTASIRWSTHVGGTSFAGSSVVDVNMDGQLDVIVATSEGNVYALNGVTGQVVPKYPYKASKGISGNVLVTKFNRIRGPYDLVFLSDDGILHVLASDQSCESQVALADTSLVDLLLHDLSPESSRGPEVLVSTTDGSLVCLGSGVQTSPEELGDEESKVIMQRLAMPGDDTMGRLSLERGVLLIESWMRLMKEVTGSTLDIYFTIHSRVKGEVFHLRVYLGSQLVHSDDQVESSMGIQAVTIPTPDEPGEGQVTLLIYDKTGFVSQDSLHLRFNQLILLDLQWLVLSPFIAMIIILLVNHGFPAKDLLPVTFPFKSK